MAKDQRFGFKYEPFIVGPYQCDGHVIGGTQSEQNSNYHFSPSHNFISHFFGSQK
jgi:hypothetical protein